MFNNYKSRQSLATLLLSRASDHVKDIVVFGLTGVCRIKRTPEGHTTSAVSAEQQMDAVREADLALTLEVDGTVVVKKNRHEVFSLLHIRATDIEVSK